MYIYIYTHTHSKRYHISPICTKNVVLSATRPAGQATGTRRQRSVSIPRRVALQSALRRWFWASRCRFSPGPPGAPPFFPVPGVVSEIPILRDFGKAQSCIIDIHFGGSFELNQRSLRHAAATWLNVAAFETRSIARSDCSLRPGMPGAPPPMMTMPPLDSQGTKTKYANGESNVARRCSKWLFDCLLSPASFKISGLVWFKSSQKLLSNSARLEPMPFFIPFRIF